MFRTTLVLMMFVICIPGLSRPSDLLQGFQEDLLVYGLNHPVAAEYSPDGRLFILEKGGNIRISKNGVLLRKPFLKLRVNDIFERGLLGLAIDPDFLNNHFIYIYRTTSPSSPKNRVERYTAKSDVGSLSSRKVLITDIRSDNGQHNGGGLRFGPDGKLYISTGDGGVDQATAQDLSGLNGKILRINPDGSIPSDNPFVGQTGVKGEIWCYGLRNPWRFAIHPQTGQLAIGDVGASRYEEINIGRAGANYGWPAFEGIGTDPRFVNPVYQYSHVEQNADAAVTGGFFYTGKKFPARYVNRLFFSDYVRGFIKTLTLDANGNSIGVEDFAKNVSFPVHLTQTTDGGLLYVDIRTGEIRKIHYVGGRNRPPVAAAEASRFSGKVPLKVQFSSKGTHDPDGDPIEYLWNFGDGQNSSIANPEHIYLVKGVYFAVLTVRDQKNGVSVSQSLRISVGNEAPVPIILRPSSGLEVHPGEVVAFAGKGTDAEDGVLNPRHLMWSAELHHNNHTHPFFDGLRGTKGSFVVPETHDTGTLFYRLKLEVIDSGRIRAETYVDLIHKP
jgi:glucose/arabinose dehydrogenase